MKTTISLPDAIFEEAKALAQQLGMLGFVPQPNLQIGDLLAAALRYRTLSK